MGSSFTGRPAGRPVDLSWQREPQSPVTVPARDRLWRAPARRELERLLGPAVRARAASLARELSRADPLEELPDTVRGERRHEDEVRHGDEHREERDPPPLPQSAERSSHALLAGE